MPDQSYPRSAVDLFDDDDPLFPDTPTPLSGLRLPDGRTLAWAEYGNPRGVPCLLIPDVGSSRLAPGWLFHDSAVPAGIRLLAVDRAGVGASDPVGVGGREDPAGDLIRMIQTLAVGRVAVIAIGRGVDDALALAERYPGVVTVVVGLSPRITDAPEERGLRHRFGHHRAWAGPLAAWVRAAGRGDISRESTWRTALGRMEPNARETVGERWREPDFRTAVAADVAQVGPERQQRTRHGEPRWVSSWSSPVAVHLWHGRHEWATHISALRALIHRRPQWELTAVPDCTALLGAWPEVFRCAEESFGNSPSADPYASLAVV